MTTSDDDWQKRIENGGTWADPTSQYSTYPGAESPSAGYPQQSGPVYGAPGSGPGIPAPQDAGAGQPFGAQPPQFPPPAYGQQPPVYGQQPAYPQQFAPMPGYGYQGADAGAPFGRDPITGRPMSDKSKTTAGLLQMLLPFVGVCGVGRLYSGSTGIGLAQLLGFWFGVFTLFLLIGFLIVPGIWIWSFVDGIMMLSGSVQDGQGRQLRS
ncbi:TM2 domain-containing protein [Rhodococcus spelaei]|uniref:TM2 domain-containing protein n=1 Tax=Rhodococcus spelaei TaxID=2546320 RepID=UPI0015EE3AE4|nr:TM2 domain-containing protein [Rhodococcus spelaei]